MSSSLAQGGQLESMSHVTTNNEQVQHKLGCTTTEDG